MADNEAFWSAEFQFNAKSAGDARALIDGLLASVNRIGQQSPAAEAAADKLSKRIIQVATAAGLARQELEKYGQGLATAQQKAAQFSLGGKTGTLTGLERGLMSYIQGVDSVNTAVARAKQKEAELTAERENSIAAAKRAAQANAALAASYSGVGAAVEKSVGAQKRLTDQVTAATATRDALGRFRSMDKSTNAGYGVMQNMVSLPGLSQGMALATQKANALKEAQDKANASLLKLNTSAVRWSMEGRSGGFAQSIPQLMALKSATEGLVLPMSSLKQNAEEVQGVMGNFYPLLVAAGIFTTASTALLGLDAAAIKTAADYQTAFAQVARTTDTEAGNVQGTLDTLRKGLLGLSTDIPVGFTDLAQIATLGNQLGVASDQVLGFTKTVAQFSTVTGVTTEQTAKSFGALGQILGLTNKQYDDFGSAITYVGRKSVATEQEILTLTERLGASAHVAGFSTQDIVALGGALASLREPAERSQGAIETYFKITSTAAAQGGAKLQRFADIIGKTSAETKALIENDPHQFFTEFLTGLGSLSPEKQITALGDLSLSGLRVSEVLRRLANNMGLVNQIQGYSETAYAKGTDLQDQYAKSTDTLNAQLKELADAGANLLDALANSGALVGLSAIVKMAKELVVAVTNFASANPAIATLGVALIGLVGAFFAVRAASIAATIAVMALGDARIATIGAAGLGSALKALTGLLIGVNIETKAASAAQGQLVFSSRAAAAGQAGLAGAMGGTAVATGVASGAMRAFKVALAGTGIGLAVVALGFLAEAFMSNADAISSIDTDTLGAALQQDQAEYEKTGQSIKMLNGQYQQSTTGAADWVTGLQKATGAQVDLNDNTTTTTSAIESQTVAYGKNAQAAIANALANDKAFQDIYKAGTIKALDGGGSGFSSKTYLNKLLGGSPEEARAYAEKYRLAIQHELAKTDTGGPNGPVGLGSALDTANGGLARQQDALKKLADYAGGTGTAIDTLLTKQQILAAATDATGGAVDAQTGAYQANTEAMDENNSAASIMADLATATINSVFGVINAAYAQQSALQQVGQAYYEQGAAVAFSGDAMQSYITNVIQNADSSQAAASTLIGLRDAILKAGFAASATAPTLKYLNDTIAQLGGGTATQPVLAPTKIDFSGFQRGFQQAVASAKKFSSGVGSAGSSAAKAAKEVRTLKDYASDLSGVFDRAFSLRFDVQTSKDDITSQFQAMKDSAKEAAKSIQDAKDKITSIRAEISKLKADNQQQTYFLSVARQFGDNLRAGQIQGQIDSNNADIAAKKTDLSSARQDQKDAEDLAKKSLKGNTKGAIENRKALSDLVGKYKDYISKLAESGLSQKELTKKVQEAKKRFTEQAESLGYNKTQIRPYIGALDDMIQVIKKVPRNITVTANADPAIQALNEFQAKAKSVMDKVKSSLGGGSGGGGLTFPKINDPNDAAKVKAASIKAQMAGIAAYMQVVKNGLQKFELSQDLERLRKQLTELGFAEGGFTGTGGKYQPAGIVHRGEYVIPQKDVNQRTGLPYADALGRLVKGQQGRMHYSGGGYVDPGISVVELGPSSMRVLRQAVHTEVKAVISAEKTANAVNSVNSTRRRRGGDGA